MPRRRRANTEDDCEGAGCFIPHCKSCWGSEYHSWAPDQDPERGGIPYVDPDCYVCQAHPPPRPIGRELFPSLGHGGEAARQRGLDHGPYVMLATEYWDWSSGVPRRRPLQQQEQAANREVERDPVPPAEPQRLEQQRDVPDAAEPDMDIAEMVNALDERVLRRALIAAARYDPETHRDVVRHYRAQQRRPSDG